MTSKVPYSLRVSTHSPEWAAMTEDIRRAFRLTARINKLSLDDLAEVRSLFAELTGQAVDETLTLIPPFSCEYGLRLRVGRRVAINQNCTIYDMGGVEIGERVMIGPNVSLITTGHPLAVAERRAYIEAKPIRIEAGVWLAAGATVIGGVTVGENAVVGAGSVVTRDVPANSFVGGNPARLIRTL